MDEGEPGPLSVDVGVEVEQVGLDGQTVPAEGRAVSDAGGGGVPLSPHPQPAAVDAELGQALAGGHPQVGSRVAEPAPHRAAPLDGAVHEIGSPEQPTGLLDLARQQRRANPAGGDRAPALHHRLDLEHVEAVAGPETAQVIGVPLPVVTKGEAGPDHQAAELEPVVQAQAELLGAPLADLAREVDHHHDVDAQGGEPLALLVEGGELRGRAGRVQDRSGMGLEGDDRRDRVELSGDGHGGAEQALVAAVDTVEDAHAAHRRRPGRVARRSQGVLELDHRRAPPLPFTRRPWWAGSGTR